MMGMSFKIIEGTWDEVQQHAQELEGRRVRVIVFPEAEAPPQDTGAALLAYLTAIGFVGQWTDRTDLPDSPDYVRELRQQIAQRDVGAGH
jgi:hypothetical protein